MTPSRALASRDLIGGNEWVKANKDDADIAKATEKAKKAFAGQEIKGKKLGVIGLGAIGQLVANAAIALGMEVYGYDPYLSVNAAWNLSSEVKHIVNVEDIYKECNYITVHVPALDSTAMNSLTSLYEKCRKKIHDPGADRRDVGERSDSGSYAIKNLTIPFGTYTVVRE